MSARIRIATTSAAPSTTAIVDDADLPAYGRAVSVAQMLSLVWARGWNCTKVIIVREVRGAEILVDFLQVRSATAPIEVRVGASGDCGNSMVAAVLAVPAEPGCADLRVRNRG